MCFRRICAYSIGCLTWILGFYHANRCMSEENNTVTTILNIYAHQIRIFKDYVYFHCETDLVDFWYPDIQIWILVIWTICFNYTMKIINSRRINIWISRSSCDEIKPKWITQQFATELDAADSWLLECFAKSRTKQQIII